MKKTGIFLFVFLSALLVLNIFSTFIYAQDDMPGAGDVERIQNFSEKLTDEEKRNYLIQEWTDMFLKNPVISNLDKFFITISPVFLVLFGEPYTFSGILFLIVFLWFYLAFKFSEILKNYSSFSAGISWILGLLITLVMAHLKVLRKFAEFFVWLALYKEAAWWRFLIFIAIFVVLIIIYKLTSQLGKEFKENKEKNAEKDNREKLKQIGKVSEEIVKSVKKQAE